MDEVKYKKGDIVLFRYGQKIKNGTIVIVDAQGTFFQQEEPSYDIEVTNDRKRKIIRRIVLP